MHVHDVTGLDSQQALHMVLTYHKYAKHLYTGSELSCVPNNVAFTESHLMYVCLQSNALHHHQLTTNRDSMHRCSVVPIC